MMRFIDQTRNAHITILLAYTIVDLYTIVYTSTDYCKYLRNCKSVWTKAYDLHARTEVRCAASGHPRSRTCRPSAVLLRARGRGRARGVADLFVPTCHRCGITKLQSPPVPSIANVSGFALFADCTRFSRLYCTHVSVMSVRTINVHYIYVYALPCMSGRDYSYHYSTSSARGITMYSYLDFGYLAGRVWCSHVERGGGYGFAPPLH